MINKRGLIKAISASCLLIIVVLAGLVLITLDKMEQSLTLPQAQIITIERGTSFNHFSKRLVKDNWLPTRFWLKNYVRIYPQQAQIKSGTYKVDPGTTVEQLLALVVSGKEHQFAITFIEGSTFKQILAQLEKHPYIRHDLKNKSIAEIAALLNIDHKNPEGWFFPDTYAFTHATQDVDILMRANKKMREQLALLWKNRAKNLPYQSPYQALIMASIIEKESGLHAEQGIISSVFVNRLRKKMRLQTDPTVIYGLGERYQGDIKYSHLREKTAYNTYRINGLPPTPIASAGKKALYATLHPETTDYLYFVSNGDGKHIFSTNITDHNKAVRKYQLGKNN